MGPIYGSPFAVAAITLAFFAVAAITLALIDAEKEQDQDTGGHGSKVMLIPFDGAALDRDLQSAADSPKP